MPVPALDSFFQLPDDQLAGLRSSLGLSDSAFAALRLAHRAQTAHRDPRQFELADSGDAPVVIQGALLAEVSGSFHLGKKFRQWVDLYLYQTTKGTYVLHRVFRSEYKGEATQGRVVSAPALDKIISALQSWTPRQLTAVGFPADAKCPRCGHGKDQFAAKQKELMDALDAMYQHRVSRLLDDMQAKRHIE